MTILATADTGPLVAFLDGSERHHIWAVARVRDIAAPLLVCEAVLAETMYLLSRLPEAQEAAFELLRIGALRLSFSVAEHLAELSVLHRKYRDRPMSFADACIVRMAELHRTHAVFTLDSDFTIYRKLGHEPLPLIYPDQA